MLLQGGIINNYQRCYMSKEKYIAFISGKSIAIKKGTLSQKKRKKGGKKTNKQKYQDS